MCTSMVFKVINYNCVFRRQSGRPVDALEQGRVITFGAVLPQPCEPPKLVARLASVVSSASSGFLLTGFCSTAGRMGTVEGATCFNPECGGKHLLCQ